MLEIEGQLLSCDSRGFGIPANRKIAFFRTQDRVNRHATFKSNRFLL